MFKIKCCSFRIMKKTIHWMILTFMIISIMVAIAPLVQLKQYTTSSYYVLASPQPKENVTITALFNQMGKEGMNQALLNSAINKLRSIHPELGINLRYIELHDLTHESTKNQMLKAITNGTPTDVMLLDQTWLGEFAEKGLLTNLSNYTERWGRAPEWYQSNLAGGVYKGKMYGIWAWTDIRGIWYWKDLLNKAGVNPDSLKTWDGYIASAKKLNAVLRPQGIEGVHLTGASHSPDVWYPYLWMLGGDILKMKSGHPTRGTYWFPAFNSTEGVKAMNFIKQQVDAGIKPQRNHFYGLEFLERKFAVMIEGSWLPVSFLQRQSEKEFEDKIGFIPALPVLYKNNQTSTLMGGYALGIPKASTHKNLAWKLIELTLEPKILGPYLRQTGVLPTQISMGKSDLLNSTALYYPYYRELVSAIPFTGTRPSIPEYPQIANDIRQAIYEVQFENKDPRQALAEAASKSANTLGW